MRVTVHRVEVALYHGDRLQIVWWEHSFKPSERVIIDRDDCVNVVWSTSKPVEVDTPPLCRLGDVELPRNLERPPAIPPARHRLITPFDAMGWDATTVYHAAVRGLRGFRLALKPVPLPAPPIPSPGHPAPIPIPLGSPSAIRWGIEFYERSPWPDGAVWERRPTYLAATSLRPGAAIASTRTRQLVATWETREEAKLWLDRSELDPTAPVPIGIGYIFPVVAQVPDGDPNGRFPGFGVEFELTRPPSAPPPWESAGEFKPDPAAAAVMSKMAKLHRRPRESAQALFAFSDED